MKAWKGTAVFVVALLSFHTSPLWAGDGTEAASDGTKQDAAPQPTDASKDKTKQKDQKKEANITDSNRLRKLIDWEMDRLNQLGPSSGSPIEIKLPKSLTGKEASEKDGISLDEVKNLLASKKLSPDQEKELLGALRVTTSELQRPERASRAAHDLTRDELTGISQREGRSTAFPPDSVLKKLTGKDKPVTAGELDKILRSKEFDPGKLTRSEWNQLLGQVRLVDSNLPGKAFPNSLALDRFGDNLFRALARVKQQSISNFRPQLFSAYDSLPMTPITRGGPLEKPNVEFRARHPEPIGGWAQPDLPVQVFPASGGGGGAFPGMGGAPGTGGGGGGQIIGQGGGPVSFPGGPDAFASDVPERPGEHMIRFNPEDIGRVSTLTRQSERPGRA